MVHVGRPPARHRVYNPRCMRARLTPLLLASLAAAQDKVDFAKQIQPIFAARCYECHGEEEQEADLRLDRRSGVFHAKEEDWVIKPGKADTSPLVQRIKLPPDDADVMPAEGDPLTPEQIALIERWIQEGATWPEEAAAAAATHVPAAETFAITLTASEKAAADAAVARLQAR